MAEPVDQQVTSKTPATKQKNPKRVAAGKAIAERTWIAREAQKKALIEAQSLIAQAKQADPPPTLIAQADPPPAQVTDTPSETTKNVLTTTQWLSVISIIVSLVGIYYKREEIKNVFAKKAPPQSPVLPRAPPPVDAASKSSIRKMDFSIESFFILLYHAKIWRSSSFLKSGRRQWDIHTLG